MERLSLGGYSYPSNVNPFTINEWHNNGEYGYSDPLQPLKAVTLTGSRQSLFDVSLSRIGTYALPITNDITTYYIAFTFAGITKVTRGESFKHVSTAPILDIIIDEGEESLNTGEIVKPLVIYENVSRETFIYYDSETISTDVLASYLATARGAVNAYLIYQGENSTFLRHGIPIYGDYPAVDYGSYLIFSIYKHDNPIQYHLGRLYHKVNRALATGGSGGGTPGEDWGPVIAELRADLTNLEGKLKTTSDSLSELNENVNNYQIRWPTSTGTATAIGLWAISDKLNERVIALESADSSGYDDTELRNLISALRTDLTVIQDRLNTFTLKDGDTTIIESNIEAVMQYVYDYAKNSSGGSDPALAGRVTDIEDRLNIFELRQGGEVVQSGTIEVIAQYLYDYMYQSLSAINDTLEGHTTTINAIEVKNEQQDIDIAARAVVNHASTGDTFGIATATLNGHVKLTNTISASGASGGYAATPNAVNQVLTALNALTERVTALENSTGGGDIWTIISNNNSVDQYTATGFYTSAAGSYNISVNYDGYAYSGGRLWVMNGWDNSVGGGVITPTRAIVQIYFHTQSNASSGNKGRAILTLQRVAYATATTQPSELTWTDWEPLVNVLY